MIASNGFDVNLYDDRSGQHYVFEILIYHCHGDTVKRLDRIAFIIKHGLRGDHTTKQYNHESPQRETRIYSLLEFIKRQLSEFEQNVCSWSNVSHLNPPYDLLYQDRKIIAEKYKELLKLAMGMKCDHCKK
jgi:hypothetical protein